MRTASAIRSLLLLIAVALHGSPSQAAAADAGFGPPMFVVANVPLGTETSALGDRAFELHNNSARPMVFVLAVKTPKAAALLGWEMGYEEIPDPSWCRLEKQTVEVAPKSIGRVKLFVTVPEKPENFNRRWMVAVACRGQAPTGGTGVALQLVARVGVETLPKEGPRPAVAGTTSVAPSVLPFVGAIPGETFEAAFLLRNDSGEAQKYSVKRLLDLETDPEKHGRYFQAGSLPVLKESWVVPSEPIRVENGAEAKVVLKIKVPAGAQVGPRYEELIFLQDPKGRTVFARLQVQVHEKQPNVEK